MSRTALFAVFVAATPLSASPTPAAPLQFWRPPPDVSACFAGSAAPLKFESAIVGWRPGNTAIYFVDAIGRNLAAALSSTESDTSAFVAYFMRAARSGAFTRAADPDEEGPSVVLPTALVMISAAYAVSLFDARDAWSEGERHIALRWGERLDRNLSRAAGAAGENAAIAAARLSWGAATGQETVFQAGLDAFRQAGEAVGNTPYFTREPRTNNEILALMLLAAEAAARSGVNAYEIGFGRFTLHDLVRAHARQTLPGDGSDQAAGAYFSPVGFAAHLAWIPVYMNRFSGSAVAGEVQALHRALQQVRPGAYYGSTLGGPTGCLWGF